MRIPVSKLSTALWSRPRYLLTRLSFEERSTVITAAAPSDTNGILFASEGCSERAQAYIDAVLAAHSLVERVSLRVSDPLYTARQMYKVVVSAAEAGNLSDAIIDITAFRREELLILLHALSFVPPEQRRNCEFAYTEVGEMPGPLSGKVVSTRSVVGFAGVIWPTRQTRLVVLMGFEIPRARAIIETYEPKCLVIGRGEREKSINSALWEKNEAFFDELQSLYSNVEHVFSFSPRDPLDALQQLEKEIPKDDTMNTVIAPLNTKLSTLGAGLYAQRHSDVQLCYAEVGSYNEETYSTVGENVHVLKLSEMLESKV